MPGSRLSGLPQVGASSLISQLEASTGSQTGLEDSACRQDMRSRSPSYLGVFDSAVPSAWSRQVAQW